MLFIINKEKIKSYIISLATVIILFTIAGTVNINRNTIETTSNIQHNVEYSNTNKNEQEINYYK